MSDAPKIIPEPVVHIPGAWPDGTVRPACGEHGVMQLEAYDIGSRGRPGSAMRSMHPHVTCEECGNALVSWHLSEGVITGPTIRWQAWLRSSRKEAAAERSTFMMRLS